MSAGSSSVGSTEQDMSRERPSEKRQNRWDRFAIIGCIAMAVIWYWYGSLRQNPDVLGCSTMVGLPILIKIFRARIDQGLLKIPGLQSLRERTPPVARIGISLAMPLFFSTVLYTQNIRNYPLMFWTLLLSVAISYALLRQPSRTDH